VRASTSILILTLLSASGAHAHGFPPYVERIAFDPTSPDRIVAQFTFGLIASEDRGASWRWICGAGYGGDFTRGDNDLLVTAEGATLVATFNGAVRGERSLCEFAPTATDVLGVDLAADPHVPGGVWLAAGNFGGVPDELLHSADGGRTFTAVGGPAIGILLERVAPAASDANRVYLSAFMFATVDTPRRAFVMRSNDGGARFDYYEIALEEGEYAPVLLGVDPTNADRLFVRLRRGDRDPLPERLLYSEDGAVTFMPALFLPAIGGLAISADGQKVWVGSSLDGGLWLAQNGSVVFERIGDVPVRCLETRGSELWLCADPYRAPYALGRSTDDGVTIEPVLDLGSVDTPAECPTCAASALICPAFQDDLRYDLSVFLGDGTAPPPMPMDAGVPLECTDGSLDAGLDAGGEHVPAGGCACRAARGSGSGLPMVLLAAAVLAWSRRPRHLVHAKR
jgi:hypothetical protein